MALGATVSTFWDRIRRGGLGFSGLCTDTVQVDGKWEVGGGIYTIYSNLKSACNRIRVLVLL